MESQRENNIGDQMGRITREQLIGTIENLWLDAGVIKPEEILDTSVMLEGHTTEELSRIFLEAAKTDLALLALANGNKPPPLIYGNFGTN